MAFMMGNTCVSYSSRMQKTVALSTAESEYMSISATAKTAVWMHRLFDEIANMQDTIDIHVGEIIPSYRHDTKSKKIADIKRAQLVYNDNKSAVCMVNNDQSSRLSKHISKIHHWAREQVAAGILEFKHVAGVNNVSDIFTKPLPAEPFRKHRHTLGLRSYSDIVSVST